ncbi:Oxysterol-binding protein OBPa [Microbotryomycetes sp. JL221]|nr:Oxysterol-binding protein OBPa [Microbotryomycetes sp. JL221]
MGLSSIIKGAPAAAAGNDKAPEGAPEDTEVLDEEPKNMLLAIVKQLSIGMDLSKITLPVFVLEPRSMLERITDFHSHPEILHGVSKLDSAEDRFVEVLRYYLAGWHIKPKGVKKPYNPILGEFFRCRYDYPDGTVAYYVAEQVSHHPPISAWYFASPDTDLELYGELRPKSKFLGNSAATIMEGENKVKFLSRPDDGEYQITMPNMYARGILFGKMVLELGDQAVVKNEETGLYCDIDFKTKGFFTGTYNAIHGKLRGPKGEVGEIQGSWSDKMDLSRKGQNKETFFDAHAEKVATKTVAPEDKQAWNESRKLWTNVTAAIKAKDLDAATDAKTKIEDAQRETARQREEKGEKHQPRFFELVDGWWHPKFEIPQGEVAQQTKAVRDFVYGEDFEPERPKSA